jgi:Tfp pilus assembly protein PilF
VSLIADALKKAQRIGVKPVEGLPPFDLKKEPSGETKPAAAAAPSQAPRPVAVVQPSARPAAAPASAPRPSVKAQPADAQASPIAQASPAAQAVRPKAKRKLLSGRLLVVFVLALGLAAGALYYVNRVYLPSLQQGGMSAAAPERAVSTPAAETPAQPETAVAQAADSAAADTTRTAADSSSVLRAESGKADTTSAAGTAAMQVTPVEPAKVQSGQPAPVLTAQTLQTPLAQPGGTTAQTEFPIAQPPAGVAAAAPLAPLTEPSRGEIVPRDKESREIRPDIYHFNMAVYFQRNGDIQSALDQYQKVIDISPYNAEAFSNMGVLYNQLGEYGKAVSVLQKALLVDPRYSKAHNNLGLAYYRSGQFDQAQTELERAVELEPSSQDACNNLGLVHRKMGRTRQAEEAFQRAITLDANYGAAHYNLALLYDETGRLDRAIEHYRAFLDSGGGTPEINERVRNRLLRLGSP